MIYGVLDVDLWSFASSCDLFALSSSFLHFKYSAAIVSVEEACVSLIFYAYWPKGARLINQAVPH